MIVPVERRWAAKVAVGLVVSVGLAAGAGPGEAAGEPAAEDLGAVKARGELRIGADPTAGEPYFWLKGGKTPAGFEAEIGQAIAKQLGVKAHFVATSWRDLLDAVRAGRVDMALNALEVRQDNGVVFSTPYYVSSQAIVIRPERTGIYGLTDLVGRKVATTDGSVAASILGQLKPVPQIRLFADTQGPFQDLLAGRSDAVLLESAMGRSHVKADPKHFKVAGLPLLPRPYAVAGRKTSPLLMAAVSKALRDMRTKHDLARILSAYNLYDAVQAGAPAPPKAPVASASPASPEPSSRPRRRHRLRPHRQHPSPIPESSP